LRRFFTSSEELIMGENFYGREEEVRNQQQRANHRNIRGTMETVQLENQAAQDDVEARAEHAPVSALGKLKQAIAGLFGRR
jgi:hypothetical protein